MQCCDRVAECRGKGVASVLFVWACRRLRWPRVARGCICRPGHRCPSSLEKRVDVRVRRRGSNWNRVCCHTGTGCSCPLGSGRGMAMWEVCSGYEVAWVRIVSAWIYACGWQGNVPGERQHWGGWSGRCSTWGPGIRLHGGQRRSWSRGMHSWWLKVVSLWSV